MMISPQVYVDELKNEPFEKLVKERERLYKELKKIEKDAFDLERKSDAWNIWDYPKVCVNLQADVR